MRGEPFNFINVYALSLPIPNLVASCFTSSIFEIAITPYYFPVLPNAPSPLTVLSNSSTSVNSTSK